jgi:Fe-Mn family superoxide dismutase
MSHSLPDLPYNFNALEPFIDEQTMRIHHGKHHAAYVEKLNTALDGHPDWAGRTLEDLIIHVADAPEAIRTAVRNNGGGHYNHTLFWQFLAPAGSGGGGEPRAALAEAINRAFSGFDQFRDAFGKAAATRFGSGWAWLTINEAGQLSVSSTPNQDNPLMKGIAENPGTPLLGLDVWEHAYYLKYQNRRPEYIEAFWNIVNWGYVAQRYETAAKIAHAVT